MWTDGSQHHIGAVGKGSNMQKVLKKQIMCSSWRIFLKNILTAKDLQGTHEELSKNIKTKSDYPGIAHRIKN